MIGYIKGRTKDKAEEGMLVEVGGVGYEVTVAKSLLENFKVGEEIELYTHYHFNEYNQELFGFGNKTERDFFRTLIEIPGIGPKFALKVLSKVTVNDIKNAVAKEDPEFLITLGLGKKTAERIVEQLKGKIGEGEKSSLDSETVSALLKLGYDRSEVLKALKEVPRNIDDPSRKIKAALGVLAK